jgi:hypothetical protein
MRDLKTERYLRRGHWRFTYEEAVSIADIDLDGSAHNAGRLDTRLDEERLVDYACCMEAGDEFPAVVLLKIPGAKHLVATGMHRLIAAARWAKPPRKTFAAYLVREPSAYRREFLVRQLNSIEGHGYDRREKMLQVLALHENNPDIPVKQLAEECRVKPETLAEYIRERDLDREANEVGLLGFQTLARSIKLALGTIKNSRCRLAAADAVLNLRLKGTDAVEFARQVATAAKSNEAAGIRVVEKKREAKVDADAKAKAHHGKTPTARAVKFISNCKTLLRHVPNGIDALHLASLVDLKDARLAVRETLDLLQAVLTELDNIARHAA